ncbi:beta-microseminoprotein-like [Xenopus tropicalis]|uniref:Beta-microseminoprotein-like n=1 Tax=Xenopus tropicalis TaxID=8364 RepID=A0A8J1JZE4_XENTR|nr:beta-microseminoprotein-like [Xenopus tropicalis]
MLQAYSSTASWNLLLFPILASSFLALLCNAACRNNELSRVGPGITPNGCMDGDVMRPFNSTWNPEPCIECNCTESGLTCCPTLNVPVITSGDCEVVVNRTACTYLIRKLSDKAEMCQMYVLL